LSTFVLDCSVVMAWCFEDEFNAFAQLVADRLAGSSQAIVPVIWPLEVTNVLLVGERRGRISAAHVHNAVRMLTDLPIAIDSQAMDRTFREITFLARQHKLSTYDASYLDLALYRGCPLATLDAGLRNTAVQLGIDTTFSGP